MHLSVCLLGVAVVKTPELPLLVHYHTISCVLLACDSNCEHYSKQQLGQVKGCARLLSCLRTGRDHIHGQGNSMWSYVLHLAGVTPDATIADDLNGL